MVITTRENWTVTEEKYIISPSPTSHPPPTLARILRKMLESDIFVRSHHHFRSPILCKILEPDIFHPIPHPSPILSRKFEPDTSLSVESNCSKYFFSSIARGSECWLSEELNVLISTSHHFQRCHKISLWAWNLPKLLSPSNFAAFSATNFPFYDFATHKEGSLDNVIYIHTSPK